MTTRSRVLVEMLYHLLRETVHVYVEHREQGHDVGASSFLYPFLGRREQAPPSGYTPIPAISLWIGSV